MLYVILQPHFCRLLPVAAADAPAAAACSAAAKRSAPQPLRERNRKGVWVVLQR